MLLIKDILKVNDTQLSCKPFDVSVLSSGDFYVVDSCNSRVVKFSKHCNYLFEWPISKINPQLALNERQNLICLSGFRDVEIDCFDLNGNEVTRITLNASVHSIAFASVNSPFLYAITGTGTYSKEIVILQVKTGNVIKTIKLDINDLEPISFIVVNNGKEMFILNSNSSSVLKLVLNEGKVII